MKINNTDDFDEINMSNAPIVRGIRCYIEEIDT
jgi:hypothetical protein